LEAATHVVAAIERLADWLIQHGGGLSLEAGSTYGLHLLYLATLLGCVALLRRLHRMAIESPEADPAHFIHGARSNSPHALLFPYEAAFLAGGPERVVETALAALLEEGWIASSASGRLALGGRGDLVTSPDSVAIGVLAVVAGGPAAPARDVRRRAAAIREVRGSSGILYARRLVVAEATRRRLRLLRWVATGVLAVAGAALLMAVAARSPGLTSIPVLAAAAVVLAGLVAPALAWRRPVFRTVQGEAELFGLRGAVCDKARWVAGRVWSDQPETSSPDDGPWADVDRIVDALRRPAASRPVQLGWLWGREDGLMAVALRGAHAVPDRGLRRGLLGGGRSAGRDDSSTGLSTSVHKMVRPDGS
jgi:uncharacterized protein (TIGR04222 family)